MKRNILNILLYISSFIPLYFLIVIKELIEIANGNLTFNVTNTTMISLNFLLIICGIVGVLWQIKLPHRKITIIEVKNITRDDFLPYFPLFVLFALAFELQFVSMAVVYVLIIIMLGVVYIKNDLFYINPFLNILGFCTYEISFKENDRYEQQKVFSFKKDAKNFSQMNGLFLK